MIRRLKEPGITDSATLNWARNTALSRRQMDGLRLDSFRCSKFPLVAQRTILATVIFRRFCQCGCKRVGVRGRPTVVAATASILFQGTIIGILLGVCCKSRF